MSKPIFGTATPTVGDVLQGKWGRFGLQKVRCARIGRDGSYWFSRWNRRGECWTSPRRLSWNGHCWTTDYVRPAHA